MVQTFYNKACERQLKHQFYYPVASILTVTGFFCIQMRHWEASTEISGNLLGVLTVAIYLNNFSIRLLT